MPAWTSKAFATLALTTALMTPAASHAEDYDMDCKLILCMAGGFPAGCSDAYSYMIKRITSFPPKPPIGFCALADGSEYTGAKVDAGRVSQWVCADPNKQIEILHDDRNIVIGASCYDSISYVGGQSDHEQATRVVHGGSPAYQLDYRVQVEIETGNGAPYRSSTFYVDFDSDFVREVKAE